MFIAKPAMPGLTRSLSGRLLWLTVAFVMLAEILIFAPSVGRFLESTLQERIKAGHLAALALRVTSEHSVSPELQADLLEHAGAISIALIQPDGVRLMLMLETPYEVKVTHDLRTMGIFDLVGHALAGFFDDGSGYYRVTGTSTFEPGVVVDVVAPMMPLRDGLLDFGLRILALSLVISLVTSSLVFMSLHRLMVRPMRRITQQMVNFARNPEAPVAPFDKSNRKDEIGVAQEELEKLQEAVRSALRQKQRLAALGTAVSKISHDLRNILSTARLVSDRIADSNDPDVRRTTPTLLKAIDRAVDLCERTLTFVGEGALPLQKSTFTLQELLDEVSALLSQPIERDFEQNLAMTGDREQLFRVIANLAQNAFQAGATRVTARARRLADSLTIDLEDNGPGLPPRARENLFHPFAGSGRVGGTGLGLAIARELVEAHGGRIALISSDGRGTIFRIELPFIEGQASAPRREEAKTSRQAASAS